MAGIVDLHSGHMILDPAGYSICLLGERIPASP